MSQNELPPEMLAQAQMLGGQRGPTENEIKEMQKSMIAMAHTQVASAIITSLLGTKDRVDNPVSSASSISAQILDRSEATSLSEELTRTRNQLAVGQICADIRGGALIDEELVERNFVQVEQIIAASQLYAQKQLSQ